MSGTCQELVWKLQANLSSSVPSYIRARSKQTRKKIQSRQIGNTDCCRCTKLVRNLSGNSRLNLSSSVPSYIDGIFRHLSKKIHSCPNLNRNTEFLTAQHTIQHKTSNNPPACLIRHGFIVVAPGCQGRASTSPCCRRRRPTGGGGPRSKGGSPAGRQRGNRGIVVALAQ